MPTATKAVDVNKEVAKSRGELDALRQQLGAKREELREVALKLAAQQVDGVEQDPADLKAAEVLRADVAKLQAEVAAAEQHYKTLVGATDEKYRREVVARLEPLRARILAIAAQLDEHYEKGQKLRAEAVALAEEEAEIVWQYHTKKAREAGVADHRLFQSGLAAWCHRSLGNILGMAFTLPLADVWPAYKRELERDRARIASMEY